MHAENGGRPPRNISDIFILRSKSGKHIFRIGEICKCHDSDSLIYCRSLSRLTRNTTYVSTNRICCKYQKLGNCFCWGCAFQYFCTFWASKYWKFGAFVWVCEVIEFLNLDILESCNLGILEILKLGSLESSKWRNEEIKKRKTQEMKKLWNWRIT